MGYLLPIPYWLKVLIGVAICVVAWFTPIPGDGLIAAGTLLLIILKII